MPVNLRVCVLRSHRDSWVLWIQPDGMDWGVTIHFSIEIQLVLAIREQERGERVIESSVAQRGQWSGHTERQKCSHRPNPQLLIASLYCKGSYFFPPRMTHCRSISLFHSMQVCIRTADWAWEAYGGWSECLSFKRLYTVHSLQILYMHITFYNVQYANTDTIQYPIIQRMRLVHFKCDK